VNKRIDPYKDRGGWVGGQVDLPFCDFTFGGIFPELDNRAAVP